MRQFLFFVVFTLIASASHLKAQLDSVLLNKVSSLVSIDSAIDNLERLTGEKS
ncbi:MAG: hypothetical protein ACM3U1_05020 [Chloroflexota bacterium]